MIGEAAVGAVVTKDDVIEQGDAEGGEKGGWSGRAGGRAGGAGLHRIDRDSSLVRPVRGHRPVEPAGRARENRAKAER